MQNIIYTVKEITNICFNIYYFLSKFIMKLLDIVYHTDFKFIVTIYIGIVALIIALITLVTNKDNRGTRNKEFATLVKNSRIKILVTLMIVTLFISIFEILIENTYEYFSIVIKLFVLLLISWSIWETFNSFWVTISFIVNKEFRENKIKKFINDNVIRYIINEENEMKVYKNFKEEFIQQKFQYISYEESYVLDFENRYESIISHEKCYIKNLKLKNLCQLDREISLKYNKIVNNDKPTVIEKTKQNNEIVILKVISGKELEENGILLYVDKNYKELLKDKEAYFNLLYNENNEKSILEMEIDEMIQVLIEQIRQDNIIYSDIIISEFKDFYDKILKYKSDKLLRLLNEKIYKICRWSLEQKKYITITDILYNYIYKSLEYSNYMYFEEYLILYINMRLEDTSYENINNLIRDIDIIGYSINRNINISEREKYIYCILYAYQNIIKKMLDIKEFDLSERIIDIVMEKKKCEEIYKAHMFISQINSYSIEPEKYKGLDIPKAIYESKKSYQTIWADIIRENSIFIGISEWILYLYNKESDIKIKKNLANIIIRILLEFKNYYTYDIIQFLIRTKKNDNIITKKWRFWEADEPENKGEVYTPIFDITNIISIMLINSIDRESYILDKDEYINKNNIYIFEKTKQSVQKVEYDFIFEKLDLSKEIFEQKKIKTLKYLEKAKEECQQKRNEIIKNGNVLKEVIECFKKEVYDKINIRDNALLKYFRENKLISISSKTSNKAIGYNNIIDKEGFIESPQQIIKFYSKEYAEGIMRAESKYIIDEWIKISKEVDDDIDNVIEQFKNKNNVIIFTPYVTHKFGYNYETKRHYYLYKDIEIEVIENISIRDNYIITNKESLGKITFNKLDEKEFVRDIINETLQVSLIDYSNEKEELNKTINSKLDWLDKYENKEEYLKEHCNIRVYESMEYKLSENAIFYRVKINY